MKSTNQPSALRKGAANTLTTIAAVALLAGATFIACGESSPPTQTTPTAAVAQEPQPQPTNTPEPAEVPNEEPTLMPANTMPPEPTVTEVPAAEQPAPTVMPEPEPEPTSTPAPPPPTAAPTLDPLWYARKQTGEVSPAGTYENHPYGPQLDLMDGNFDYFPNIAKKGKHFPPAPEFYVQRPLGKLLIDVQLELAEAEGLSVTQRSRIKDTDLIKSFMETAGWEIVDNEEPVVRFWGILSTHSMVHEYRIGFTVTYPVTSTQPRLLDGPLVLQQGGYPIKEFLGDATHTEPYVLQRVE